jgi:4-amino-4-deoxy-L-arabinose transferase-like glycosyltransferase
VGACVVPLVSAVVAQVLLLGMFLQTSNEPAMDAIGGPLGLGSYLLDTGIVACFGAPVLGIAVARWWRFPGAGVVATLLLFAAVLLTMGPSHMEGWGQSWWVQAPATAAPYVDWVIIAQTGEVAGPRRGSPVGHLVYAVALSGLAVWAAVIKDAEGAQRVRWTRIGWTLTGLAAASYLWALLG